MSLIAKVEECEMVANGSPPPTKIPQIKSGGTSVTLPLRPHDIALKFQAEYNGITYPADNPIVMSMGAKVDEMIWEGRLKVTTAAPTLKDVAEDYVQPLSALRRKVVYVTVTDRPQYTGYWLMEGCEFKEKGGFVNTYDFKMSFVKGSVYIVLEKPS